MEKQAGIIHQIRLDYEDFGDLPWGNMVDLYDNQFRWVNFVNFHLQVVTYFLDFLLLSKFFTNHDIGIHFAIWLFAKVFLSSQNYKVLDRWWGHCVLLLS